MKSSLETIPGIGTSITKKLHAIGIYEIEDLIGKDAQHLYDDSNQATGTIQDRCLLYTFRCAIYFVNTPAHHHQPDKLKRRNWK